MHTNIRYVHVILTMQAERRRIDGNDEAGVGDDRSDLSEDVEVEPLLNPGCTSAEDLQHITWTVAAGDDARLIVPTSTYLVSTIVTAKTILGAGAVY